MRQQTLADEGFERSRKPMRRNQFLAEMEAVIPWRDLCTVSGLVFHALQLVMIVPGLIVFNLRK
jgi:hypothetical protein